MKSSDLPISFFKLRIFATMCFVEGFVQHGIVLDNFDKNDQRSCGNRGFDIHIFSQFCLIFLHFFPFLPGRVPAVPCMMDKGTQLLFCYLFCLFSYSSIFLNLFCCKFAKTCRISAMIGKFREVWFLKFFLNQFLPEKSGPDFPKFLSFFLVQNFHIFGNRMFPKLLKSCFLHLFGENMKDSWDQIRRKWGENIWRRAFSKSLSFHHCTIFWKVPMSIPPLNSPPVGELEICCEMKVGPAFMSCCCFSKWWINENK